MRAWVLPVAVVRRFIGMAVRVTPAFLRED